MDIARKVLIVDDTRAWIRVFETTLDQLSYRYRIALNKKQAVEALEEVEFSAALIDLRLQADDESNTEGLDILERIAESHDHTKAVLITGYGSFEIGRDAVRKHRAFHAITKAEIKASPVLLRTVIRDACSDFQKTQRLARERSLDLIIGVLSGEREAGEWEYELTQLLSPRHGISTIYELFRLLVAHFLPLLPAEVSGGLRLDSERRIAFGRFWSRALGSPVVICLGDRKTIESLSWETGQDTLGLGVVDSIAHRKSVANLMGLVVGVSGPGRADFV